MHTYEIILKVAQKRAKEAISGGNYLNLGYRNGKYPKMLAEYQGSYKNLKIIKINQEEKNKLIARNSEEISSIEVER